MGNTCTHTRVDRCIQTTFSSVMNAYTNTNEHHHDDDDQDGMRVRSQRKGAREYGTHGSFYDSLSLSLFSIRGESVSMRASMVHLRFGLSSVTLEHRERAPRECNLRAENEGDVRVCARMYFHDRTALCCIALGFSKP